MKTIRNYNYISLALAAILMLPSVGIAQEEPVLKPDVPKMDTLPSKEPLKGGIEHHTKAQSEKKQKKKLKAAASQSPFSGRSRTGGALDNNAFNAQVDESRLDASAERSIGIIGVRFVAMIGSPPVINTVFSNTPAAVAGIVPNDLIVAVDGVPTSGLTRDECYDLIIGTPNTPVTLSLRRGHNFFVRTMNRMDLNDMRDPRIKHAYMYHL
ncbi:MAG: PDZ domain-containing protein [Candidatus Obscuribacterales bacterium]|nr:PDZ domain-containing protein [Candidatus Obscuribacterales bacterium]